MTKSDLINAVHDAAAAKNIEITKKATGELIDLVFEEVSKAIQDKDKQRFAYPSFGTFSVKTRKEREGRNPRTKEAITIPASNTISFKPAPSLKDSLNPKPVAAPAAPAAPAKAPKKEKAKK